MAYKYFTKKLLEKSDEIDLRAIASDKQSRAKEVFNTNYGLPEIVDWIQRSTNNFRRSDNYFIDLDQAIQKVIFKYYASIGTPNPFSDDIEIEDVSAQPRIPSEVTSSGVKTGKPDVSKPSEVTKDDILSVIEGLEIQAELDPGNPVYAEVIEGLKIQLELM